GSGGFRHFSSNRRIDFLERRVYDGAPAERLQRLLRICAVLGILIFAGAAAAKGYSLVRSYDEETLRAHLRLGEYESFLDEVPHSRDPDSWDEVADVLSAYAADGLYEDGGTPSFFEAQVVAELEAGRFQRAQRAAELAALRGHDGWLSIAEAFELWDDEPERAAERLTDSGVGARVLALLRQLNQ
ncbi:MAG: hypothetical protein AAF368_07260, partial [Planctomycetota bacterium]